MAGVSDAGRTGARVDRAGYSRLAGVPAFTKLKYGGCVQIVAVQAEVKKNPSLEVTSWWGRLLVGRRPRRTLARAVALMGVSFILFKFVFIAIRVQGNSMSPTYRNGRIDLVNRLAYRRHGPKRGDVVAVRQKGHLLVMMKRIVGLPGERITVRHGQVLVNGQPLNEPYAKGSDVPPMRGEIVLGPNEYFVIGDNRDVSVYFQVRLNEILGKVVF